MVVVVGEKEERFETGEVVEGDDEVQEPEEVTPVAAVVAASGVGLRGREGAAVAVVGPCLYC